MGASLMATANAAAPIHRSCPFGGGGGWAGAGRGRRWRFRVADSVMISRVWEATGRVQGGHVKLPDAFGGKWVTALTIYLRMG
jgi:hypothetical protein